MLRKLIEVFGKPLLEHLGLGVIATVCRFGIGVYCLCLRINIYTHRYTLARMSKAQLSVSRPFQTNQGFGLYCIVYPRKLLHVQMVKAPEF